MIVDKDYFKRLDELFIQGFLRKVISPCGRLVLYNYTDKCVFEKKWNKHTINARGTVYELSSGKVIAKAFPKFFNFQELPVSKSRNLAKKTGFSVSEKADGSLGIVYYYDGEWRMNTRGSFTSDQAVEGLKIFNKNSNLNLLNEQLTHLFEIIYPENKIIVNYGDVRKLVLLSACITESGKEVDDFSMGCIKLDTKFEIPKRLHVKTIDELINIQSTLTSKEEGFVVRFSDGYRVKFKSKEYLKLARLLTYMTPLHFWEHMKNGYVDSKVLFGFPEEFREEVDKITEMVESAYRKVETVAKKEGMTLIGTSLINNGLHRPGFRKHLGLHMNELTYPHTVFALLDNNPNTLDSLIMKIIRPNGNNPPNIK